jgi:hypothetical protein
VFNANKEKTMLRVTHNKNIFAAALVALAGLGVFTGCSGGSGHAASTSTSTSGRAVASWATSLGQGVTVVPPPATQPTAGNSTPAEAIEALEAAGETGNMAQLCNAFEPSAQSTCSEALDGLKITGRTRNLKLGYTAIEGDQALVGFSGKYCGSPCVTVREPAAVISSGETFDTLYNQAVAAENGAYSHTYPLYPMTQLNGVWYAYAPATEFTNVGNNAG